MKYQNMFFCLCFFITSAIPARAQDSPRAEMSGGYSYLRVSPTPGLRKALPNVNLKSVSLHGWNIAGTVFLTSRAGIAFELSRHSGEILGFDTHALFPVATEEKIRFNNTSFLAGPHFRAIGSGRLVVSLSALLGVDQGKQSENACCFYDGGLSETHFAASFGGSLDLTLNNRLAIRLIQPQVYILSGKLDIQGERATTANLLMSTGLVFRFGKN